MADVDHIRHSLAHLLATVALEYDPKAKLAIGPTIDNGFYYDILFSVPLGAEMLPKFEKKMRGLANRKLSFERIPVTPMEARERFVSQPFKIELIDELEKKGEDITLYKTGDFIDLCRGGHVESTSEIPADAFTLSHIAGAYWHGDEKNQMLTRIYGYAFKTKKELDEYVCQQEEAKTRDHRKLGVELDLFVFSDLIGGGLPLFTPRGTVIRDELDSFVWEFRRKHGYERVDIPHITKKDLYEKSGHWQKFAGELFRITTREKHEFAMKPMNCPHHTQIYARKAWSYRELPQRYASTTKVYRDEQSGEIAGLTRVRSITQDDAHVFCRASQIEGEFGAIWDIVETFYTAFGFKLSVRLSFHDPEHFEKYIGTKEIWHDAEAALRRIADKRSTSYTEALGEAAMYGPKIDFLAHDSLGRKHQVATIQLDMNMPERFDLVCTNEKGEKERVVMIHSAIMGSIERFMAVLIEHTAGNFPTWLSPMQVRVVPVGKDQHDAAGAAVETLRMAGIRAELDDSNETLGKKVRQAKIAKVPYFLIIGAKEAESNIVTVESRDHGKVGTMSPALFLARIKEEIKTRS